MLLTLTWLLMSSSLRLEVHCKPPTTVSTTAAAKAEQLDVKLEEQLAAFRIII